MLVTVYNGSTQFPFVFIATKQFPSCYVLYVAGAEHGLSFTFDPDRVTLCTLCHVADCWLMCLNYR